MKIETQKLALLYTSGTVGGLANSLAVWGFGILGLNAALGVSIAPDFTPAWLYPRLVWGGLWGAVFLFVEKRTEFSFLLRTFVASLGPTLVMLLIVFPLKLSKGFFGLELGLLTPALVVVFNYIWALVTLKTFYIIREIR